MRLDIRYRTQFNYSDPAVESQNELRACPANTDSQQLIAYRVTTSPNSRVFSYTDYWGTKVDHFGTRAPHLMLDVIAEAAVETFAPPRITTAPRMDALTEPGFRDSHLEYLVNSGHTECDDEVRRIAREQIGLAGDDVVGAILAIHRYCSNRLEYQAGSTQVGTPLAEVLSLGTGVCQDYAHLAVAMCRAVGIPARYVSGYFFSADDRLGTDVEGDVAYVQTHAWMEAAVPGSGWMGLDPTNRQQVGQRHVKIGHGRDYDDVQPLRGVFQGGGTPVLTVSVEIRRMEAARQPATAEQPPIPVETPRRRASAEIPPDQQHQQQQQQQQ